MDFWRAVAILSRRRWLILTSVVVATALTFTATRLVGSRWMATVRFFSAPDVPEVPSATSPLKLPDNGSDEVNVRKQADVYTAVVRSPQVLQPALAKLGLNSLPPDLMQNIKFQVLNQRVFELQVVDNGANRAGELANALGDTFEEQYRHLYTARAEQVVKLLSQQLHDADNKLAAATNKLDIYRREHGINGTDLATVTNPVLARLQSARQQRDDATQRLSEARARLQAAQGEIDRLPATVMQDRVLSTNSTIKALEEELGQAEKKLVLERANHTEDHIQVKYAKQLRDALAVRLREEQAKQPKSTVAVPNPARQPFEQTAAELKQEINGYEATLGTLGGTISELAGQLNQYSNLDIPYQTLVADMNERSRQRNAISARLEIARSAMDVAQRQNPLVIMDRVSDLNPPVNTTQGRSAKLVVLAALFALVGTAGLIIAFDSVDRRIRSLPEAELALPGRVLAAIPQPLGSVTPAALARAAELHPLSVHSEQFRFLAVHLLSTREQGIRSIMIASAKAGQGSTVTATNLAITLAQAGQRVILVDANLRTPMLHQIFAVQNETGFASLLQRPDAGTLEEALRPTPIHNLRVIGSGPGSENPWELLRSENLMHVAHRLRDLADYVVYDTPSALAFTDALNLAPAVDAALLCVRALEPPSGAEQRLMDLLEQSDVTVLGSVLNDVPASVLDSYQNYQRYYPPAPPPGEAGGGGAALAVAEPGVATGGVRSWIHSPGRTNGHSRDDV